VNDLSPSLHRATVIAVNNVSLAYKLYDKPIDLLKEALLGGVRHDTFWAIRNISLTVHEGQRLGIIGHNGAGKTTLLQVIAGNLAPTTGDVTRNGRISSLLSMVPAWNLEETGLENIKFNLMVQGVDAKAIPALIEDIIDFTDLGPFIYQPVKTYSSGMSARLSFAIATAIDPEILVVDEVLGAGDGYFAGKAARRMQKMCERGKALLFVSHSTAAVRMMCDSCIWVENGQIRLSGPVETVVRQYEEDILRQQDETLREGNRRRLKAQEHLVTPDDIGADDQLRLRIGPASDSPQVTETHYIRNISAIIDRRRVEVPLEATDIRRDDSPAALDLHSCEWGRIFDRRGSVCRALLPRTGVRKGGHILLKVPKHVAAERAEVEISFEAASQGKEALVVDFVDFDTVEWQRLDVVSRRPLEDNWMRVTQRGSIALQPSSAIPPSKGPSGDTTSMGTNNGARIDLGPSSSGADAPRVGADAQVISPSIVAADVARARAATLFRKPVSIESVALEVDGQPRLSVDELQPFAIRVTLAHQEPLPEISVNLNIIRSDGVYVFYQPSGLNDNNIREFEGKSNVIFRFDPNPFGYGDYEVNVFATNGFSWNNIPPSEIIDRSVGNLLFKVNLARPISFGLVNLLVPVSVELHPKEPSDAPCAERTRGR
jgi:lipopolysaccharide transport system ATP-binding protein